eukprot:COSAG02_NODE_68693_length_229_cov_5.223077_1_plen_30_part_10
MLTLLCQFIAPAKHFRRVSWEQTPTLTIDE